MLVAVVGSGGIGGYYGALLAQSGHEVAFLARGAHLEAMRHAGLRVESVLGEPVTLKVRAAARPQEVGPVDIVLFTVKSYDTVAAADLLPPLLGPETAVLTLQNGVDNVDRLVEKVGGRHVLGGLCYIFSFVAAPGVIRHAGGPRRVVVGELDGSLSPRARAVHAAFAATGIPVELSSQILVEMWLKYVFISAHGGMTALTRLPTGPIQQQPETFEVYLDAVEEVAAVAAAHGIRLPAGQRDRVRQFAETLEPNLYSSLYVDLVNGRRTELETLVGHVVRLGRRYGVPTPVCRIIYAALKPYDEAARKGTPLIQAPKS